MRSLKKVLTLVLALVMVLGLVTIGASATYTDDATIQNTDAVATTSALGIFNGYEDGSFNPNGTITRQETAKMIAVALNGGTFNPTLYADASMFNDVDGLWGEGYINYLAGSGIVAGVGNDMFNPQGNITAQELAKIMLVSLGYPEDLFVGSNWALYTNRIAITAGLYADYTGTYSKVLTRDEAALIIYNALLANCVQAAWAGSATDVGISDLNSWTWTSTGSTFLETKFKCESNVGFVTATSSEFTELTGTKVVVSYTSADILAATADTMDLNAISYLDFRDMSSGYITDKVASFDGALGTPVTVYTSTKTGSVGAVIAVASRTIDATTTSSITYSTTAGMTDSAMKSALLSAGFYNTLVTANYAAAADKTGNGTAITFKQIASTAGTYDDFTLLVGSSVSVGGVSYSIYYKIAPAFAPFYLGSITATEYVFTPDDGGTATKVNKTASKNETTFYSFDSLTKGMWYTIKTATTRATVPAAIATTYGSCTSITDIMAVTSVAAAGTTTATSYNTTANTVTLDGTVYGLAENLIGSGVTGYVSVAKDVYTLARTDTADGYAGADIFLDPYGYIFAAVKSVSSAAAVSDFAYIISADVTIAANIFGTTEASVEVLTDAGTYAIYDLAFAYKSTTQKYYSGSYAFTGTDKAAITAELATHAFSYTVSDGVLTIVAQASEGTVTTNYVGVHADTSAARGIYIDSDAYSVTNDTELVYMNIADTHSKSTVTSVTRSAAQDIDVPATVYYLTTVVDGTVLSKLIVVGDEYTAASKEAYVFVSAAGNAYTDSSNVDHYEYTVIFADGSKDTIYVTEEATVGAVYALNSDGTLETDTAFVKDAVVGTITDYSSFQLTIASSTDFYGLVDGIEPILTDDDAVFEATAHAWVSLNSAGDVTGLWVYTPDQG